MEDNKDNDDLELEVRKAAHRYLIPRSPIQKSSIAGVILICVLYVIFAVLRWYSNVPFPEFVDKTIAYFFIAGMPSVVIVWSIIIATLSRDRFLSVIFLVMLAAQTVFSFAIIFSDLGIQILSCEGIHSERDEYCITHDKLSAVYFSSLIWTGLGTSEFTPIHEARVFVLMESVWGLATTGVLVAILASFFLDRSLANSRYEYY